MLLSGYILSREEEMILEFNNVCRPVQYFLSVNYLNVAFKGRCHYFRGQILILLVHKPSCIHIPHEHVCIPCILLAAEGLNRDKVLHCNKLSKMANQISVSNQIIS